MISLPCMGVDAAGVLVAIALCVIAAIEFRGAKRLRKLDPTAPALLARNQLALAAAVFLYAAWSLYLTRTDRGLMGMLIAQGLDQGGPELIATARQIVYALYAGLAIVGPAGTAGAAWFYSTRVTRLRKYLAETPPWILQMQRERGKL